MRGPQTGAASINESRVTPAEMDEQTHGGSDLSPGTVTGGNGAGSPASEWNASAAPVFSGTLLDEESTPRPMGPEGPESNPRWRPPRWLKVLGALAFVAAVVLIVGSTVRLDYYSIAPGDSYETLPLVDVEGAPTYDHAGSLYMTTVSVTPVTLLEWVSARLDSDTVLVPAEQIDGGRSSEEVDEVNEALMEGSKLNAEAVALGEVGVPVEFTGSGALVVEVSEDVPASGLLERGDVIESVDGTPISVVTDLTNALVGRAPGEVVKLIVERDDEKITVDVPLVENEDNPGKSIIGIVVQTADFDVESPVDVTIDSRNVGGPSAGLVYTLTIIDRLSPQDLTKGRRVAATGEISLDGTVGEIGGVEQKVRSVEEVEAELFLVPEGNCDAARAKAETVEVVCVSDIGEALAALDDIPGQ